MLLVSPFSFFSHRSIAMMTFWIKKELERKSVDFITPSRWRRSCVLVPNLKVAENVQTKLCSILISPPLWVRHNRWNRLAQLILMPFTMIKLELFHCFSVFYSREPSFKKAFKTVTSVAEWSLQPSSHISFTSGGRLISRAHIPKCLVENMSWTKRECRIEIIRLPFTFIQQRLQTR